MHGADPPGAGETFTEPLDALDPRFAGDEDGRLVPRPRTLVRSRGPGRRDLDTRGVRIFRVALPAVFVAGVAAVAAVFFLGLRPGPQVRILGPEQLVRSRIADRPRHVCFNDNNPCAWVALVGDRIVAFNTNGPLPQEYGRQGVGWCPSSRWYGANATGSRYDDRGRVVAGPAPRGLDRFGVHVDAQGRVVVDFQELTAGAQAAMTGETTAPAGPDCTTVPFDRNADLDIGDP